MKGRTKILFNYGYGNGRTLNGLKSLDAFLKILNSQPQLNTIKDVTLQNSKIRIS